VSEVFIKKLTVTAVTMKNAIFWDVMPCISCVNQRFVGTYGLHLQGRKIRKRGTQPPAHAGFSLADFFYLHFIEPEASLSSSVLTTEDPIQMSASLVVFTVVTDFFFWIMILQSGFGEACCLHSSVSCLLP
jgi:hypothetical protein